MIEVILGVEVSPNCERKDHCFLDPVEETMPNVPAFDVRMKGKETAKGDAPLDGSEGVGITKDILSLEVVHFLDLQSIVFLLCHNKNKQK